MKKQILTIIAIIFGSLLFAINSIAQTSTNDLLSKMWQFRMPTRVTESDNLGTPVNPANVETADINYQFRVVNVNSESLVIKFLLWNVPIQNNAGVRNFSTAAANSKNAALNEQFVIRQYLVNGLSDNQASHFKYFIINRADFESRCEEKIPKNQFTLGAMTLPIKMRFGQKDNNGTNKSYSSFTGNLSLGLSFGLKHNYNKSFAINYLTGFSLSSIPVSAETTDSFVTNETNQAAVTWHLGVLAEINNFQVGVFTGIDYLSGKINKEWVYKNRPWLGVGIGFSFFNAKKTTDTQ